MPRRPLTISSSRTYETPIRSASCAWVIPSGLMNSSSNISPGGVGARPAGILTCAICHLPLVVVRDLDVFGTRFVLPWATCRGVRWNGPVGPESSASALRDELRDEEKTGREIGGTRHKVIGVSGSAARYPGPARLAGTRRDYGCTGMSPAAR